MFSENFDKKIMIAFLGKVCYNTTDYGLMMHLPGYMEHWDTWLGGRKDK